MQIMARKADFIWNYAGLFFRMLGQFFVLPLVLSLLDASLVGLWYVFLAINSLVVTLQAGFTPAFARNVAYCWSGIKSFSKNGIESRGNGDVDYSVMGTLIAASRRVFLRIALIALVAMGIFGSMYVLSVSAGLSYNEYVPAWGVFCIAVFVNILFSYWESLLRGVADFVGINKAVIGASIAQIVSSASMLVAGMGLLSCAVGFLLQGIVFRALCRFFFRKVPGVMDGLSRAEKPSKADISNIEAAISPNAYKDTLVSVSNYVTTTANTLLCASFVGLADSSTFSVTLQLLNACVNVSAVALTTYQPALQSAFANGNVDLERQLSAKSMAGFMLLYGICFTLVLLVGMPLLGIFKPGIASNILLTALLGMYLFLWKQHSNAAMLIANTNRLPYVASFVVSAFLGIVAAYVCLRVMNGSILGIVVGPMVVQMAYNNWKWPHEAAKRLGVGYLSLLRSGVMGLARR